MKELKIGYLPDAQVREGVPLEHLKWAGQYFEAKRPDVIVCGGDFGDCPTFSVWDQPGSLGAEGRRHTKDMDAVHRGMDLFMNPIRKARGYKPRLVLTLGNHEHHITRQIARDPRWQGVISLKDLRYEQYDWTVHPFLEVVAINGVHFSHYFPSGKKGLPCTSARKILSTYHDSCIAGHQQGRDVAYGQRGDGRQMIAIIAGSFYQHDESYMPWLGNKHWRGIVMLNEVKDGQLDEMFVSLNFLKKRYGK